jgi:uncharacterized glyoxalase superfamily metalloenzyme YdcJ
MACTVTSQVADLPSSTRKYHPTVSSNDLRTMFAHSMTAMYRAEVPLYGDLVRIVSSVNTERHKGSLNMDSTQRLSLERHGAIRLGTAQELRTIRRLFQLLGMYAVGYYDLSVADLPMHATCFRPIDTNSLEANPFRVFTTLLRPELIRNDASKEVAESLLRGRNIFSRTLLQLLDQADQQGGHLTVEQVETFIPEALSTFSWQPIAAASQTQYAQLRDEHPILADIACFKSAHINHLTPRVLDIDIAKQAMESAGIPTKASIEGPPKRKWPILLRQTSFLALEEKIQFRVGVHDSDAGPLASGSHKARFGEIEERGAAVTPKGRLLYDQLLEEAGSRCSQPGLSVSARDAITSEVFAKFPDEWSTMWTERLVYCVYELNPRAVSQDVNVMLPSSISRANLQALVSSGLLTCLPITYEDFLPFSAAGIFQSNLGNSEQTKESKCTVARPDKAGFEHALGATLLSADDLYLQIEMESLRQCAESLGISCDL